MKNQKSTFFSIFFVYFLDYFGYAIAFGVFAPLILDPSFKIFSSEISFYSRNIALGCLFAVYPTFQLITAPIFGNIADHLGRKRTLCILNLGGMGGYFLAGLAIYLHSFFLLFLSRMIAGLFSSHRGICMASLSDLSENENALSKNYGTIATLGGLSWIASMYVGRFLTYKIHPAIPFWVTTILSLLSLSITFFFFYETNKTHQNESKKSISQILTKDYRNIIACFKIRGIRILMYFYLVMMMGWGINLMWLNPYTFSRFDISTVAFFILLASTGLVWSLGSSIINKILLKKFSSDVITFIGITGLFLMFILCSFFRTFFPFAVSVTLASAFGSITWTNALSTIASITPTNALGKVMGISQSFGSLALLFSPIIAGLIAGLNIFYIYPVAALFVFISAMIFCVYIKKSSLEKIVVKETT